MLAARLQHPHILSVYDSGEAAGELWFTMPFVEGESLRDRLQRERRLPVDDALRIARETLDALDCAHRHGVIHRDVKPENILLTETHALVADFGIARAIDSETHLTNTGLAVGTPILTFTGPFTIGQAHNNSPQKWVSDPYNIRDDFTLTFNKAGRHTVKLGSEYIADLLNVFVCNICMGQYDMQAVGVPIPANIDQIIPVWNDVNTWDLAALSRNTRNYTVGLGQMKVYNKRQVYSGWAQDNWEFSKVTLSLGLRYDFSTGRELQTAIEPLFGARPSDKTNFGPRLGITYSLNDKTVLRGGYGKYYGAPDDNEAMWTMLYAGEIHPQVNNDGRADFAANPFNGPVPTYAQAMASWQADVASGCATRTGAAGCKFNRIINILSPPNPTTPYSYQSSAGFQRQLGTTISVESDFTINDTRGAQNGQNVNQAFNPATGFNYPYTDRSKKPSTLIT